MAGGEAAEAGAQAGEAGAQAAGAAGEEPDAECGGEAQAGEEGAGSPGRDAAAAAAAAGPSAAGKSVVAFNVGGKVFETTEHTALRADWIGARILRGEAACDARDAHGRVFFDRDPALFERYVLKTLRDPALAVPPLPPHDSEAHHDVRQEAAFYRLEPLVAGLHREARARLEAEARATEARLEREEADLARQLAAPRLAAREKERLRVEVKRVQFELAQSRLLSERRSSRPLCPHAFSFNLLVAGVTGTGKSSSLNTLLDAPACAVSGAQAQGTRGCVLRDGSIGDGQVVTYIDTQGLGADTSVTDAELLEEIMLGTETLLRMKVVNHVLLSYDMSARATPTLMSNQLTLVDLFAELQGSCFVCFTKWNTNDVMAEWNLPLKDWVRRWRRARDVGEIDEDPPSYEVMYAAFTEYLGAALGNAEDAAALNKLSCFLAFFESRVLWMCNLDPLEQEDRAAGALPAVRQRMFEFYRAQALRVLEEGSTRVATADMTFLKSDTDTMRAVAKRLIETRDRKILQLEVCGAESETRDKMKMAFGRMSTRVTERIRRRDYRPADNMQQMRVAAGIVKEVAKVGCVLQ